MIVKAVTVHLCISVSPCICLYVLLYLAVYVCLCLIESEVCEVEQSLGSLAMEAVTLLLTANNSNAGKCGTHLTSDTGH